MEIVPCGRCSSGVVSPRWTKNAKKKKNVTTLNASVYVNRPSPANSYYITKNAASWKTHLLVENTNKGTFRYMTVAEPTHGKGRQLPTLPGWLPSLILPIPCLFFLYPKPNFFLLLTLKQFCLPIGDFLAPPLGHVIWTSPCIWLFISNVNN